MVRAIGESWWMRGGIAVLLAMLLIPLQILWRPMDIVTNLPLHGLVSLGLYPEGSPRGRATYGWGSVPVPTRRFHEAFQMSRIVAWQMLVAATAVTAYHVLIARAMRRRKPPDGITRCGWCGYDLRGASEARCPECGSRVGATPISRWRIRLGQARRTGFRVSLCLGVFLMLDWVAAFAERVLSLEPPWVVQGDGSPNEYAPVVWRVLCTAHVPQNWASVANVTPFGLVALALSLIAALVAYHAILSRPSWVPGVWRCGCCGATLPALTEPRCPFCRRSF